MSEIRFLSQFAVCVWGGVFAVMALDGCGPYVWLGQRLNARAARKTLRLLHRVTFACDPNLPIPAAWWP